MTSARRKATKKPGPPPRRVPKKAAAKAKPKAKAKMGRPKEPVPAAVRAELLDWISSGKTMSSWCAQPGKPAPRTVNHWQAKDPEFLADYARARETGGDVIADRLRDIAELPVGPKGNDVQQLRLRVDVDKWLLARWFPKRYGDRVALAGDEDSPLHVKMTDEEAARKAARLITRATLRRAKALSRNGHGDQEG